MAQVVALDREMAPDHAALAGVIGESVRLWDALVSRLTGGLGATGSWTWTGPRSGWELHIKRAGRPIATLMPGSGAFTVMVVLGREEADRAAALHIGDKARRTLEEARTYHDGRWLFLSVEDDTDVADVTTLAIQKLPARLRSALGHSA